MTILTTTPSIRERMRLLHDASEAATRVFTMIVTRGPISRIEIARTAGLSQAAVTKAVAPLVAAGIVSDTLEIRRSAGPGRPANPLAVVPDAILTMGVKVNADQIVGVVADLTNSTVASRRLPLDDGDVPTVVSAIVRLHGDLVADLGEDADRLASVGVAVSGDVDPVDGVVRESPLMGWSRVPLRELLTARLPHTITVDNDVRALTTAEHWFGVGVGTASFAIVTVGQGVGAGLHVNGEVIQGMHGVAGELGHLPLSPPEHVCSCGRRGCVEAIAATSSILRTVSAGVGREVDLDEAVALGRAGDPVAVSAFAAVGDVMGRAIASLVNLLGPEVVLLGGEGVDHLDLFEGPLRASFDEHAFGAAVRCRIVARPQTFEDWALGAASAALQAIVD